MKIIAIVILAIAGAFVVNSQINKYKGKQAYEYFKEKCETQAGEFIYRTVDNVEGLYQMRLRDPRDYFDRIRYGDIPEDPYGHTNVEAQEPWKLFISYGMKKYHFFETLKGPGKTKENVDIERAGLKRVPVFTGEKYWRYQLSENPINNGRFDVYREAVQTSDLKSLYGFTWKEVRDEQDVEYGIRGGETRIIELKTGDVLAIKRGFVIVNEFGGKSGICPKDKEDGFFLYNFISKVLKPKEHKE